MVNILINLKIKTYPHQSLNTSRGVIKSPDLAACSLEEIKKQTKKNNVIDVTRITIKRNDQTVNTHTHTYIHIKIQHHQATS